MVHYLKYGLLYGFTIGLDLVEIISVNNILMLNFIYGTIIIKTIVLSISA